MEQAERGTASRSQNVVHFLPRTTDALMRVITPGLERIDVSQPSLQLIVVTPDSATAVAVAAIELQSLIQRSAIKLDGLRTIVLAWVDDDFATNPSALAALESLFG